MQEYGLWREEVSRLQFLEARRLNQTIDADPTGSTSNPPEASNSINLWDMGSAMEEEVDPSDIAIFRIRLYLHNMVRNRALHGMQPDDTAGILEIAWDTLRSSQESEDECAIARVTFWLGVVLYYSDDITAARGHFLEANKPMVLPSYEAAYINGWIERCNESGPEKDASAYVGLEELRQVGISPRDFLTEQKAAEDDKKPNIPTNKAQEGVATMSGDSELQAEEQGGPFEGMEPETGNAAN